MNPQDLENGVTLLREAYTWGVRVGVLIGGTIFIVVGIIIGLAYATRPKT